MNNEDKLQHDVERGYFHFEKNDVHGKVYQEVFKSLNTRHPYALPSDFADSVVSKVIALKTSKRLSSDHIWFGGGIAVILLSFIMALFFFNVNVDFDLDIDFGFLEKMSRYKGLFIFGTSFIFLINQIDKFLHRNKDKVST